METGCKCTTQASEGEMTGSGAKRSFPSLSRRRQPARVLCAG
ncbi:hypothetical protein CV83915_3p0041 (plasmid) [Escherichia coli]|uniref:Uncharacterized protein n=1 Tax=Escherichia coli TaxID=562 RepID=A0A2H4TLE2_ECOLX|nr:hypothetical protein CV83915_3p0041 [Escherichia coli]